MTTLEKSQPVSVVTRSLRPDGQSLQVPGVPHSSRFYRNEWGPSSANSACAAGALFPVFLWADDAQLVPRQQLHRIDFQVRKDLFPVGPCDSRHARSASGRTRSPGVPKDRSTSLGWRPGVLKN